MTSRTAKLRLKAVRKSNVYMIASNLNVVLSVGHTVDDIDFFWEPGYPTLMYLKDNYIKHFRLTKWSNHKAVNFYATGSKEYCFKMDTFQPYNSFHSCLLEAHLETGFPETNRILLVDVVPSNVAVGDDVLDDTVA